MGRITIIKLLIFTTLILFSILISGFSADMTEKPTPPKARIIPKKITVHDDTRIDDYYWLRERDNPEVIAYLNAENAYTEAVMKHTEALQNKLYNEMKSRIKETDLSVPVRIDEYYYYSRTAEGKQYSIHCRKRGSLDAAEEVILDENELAEGMDYFAIGDLEISPDHKLLAFSMDTDGSEQYTLRIKDLTTGKILTDEVKNVYYGLAWGNDNKTIFYTILDDAKRPYKVFRHILGVDSMQDEPVYHEKDELFHLSIDKTRSKKYIFVNLESMVTSESLYLDADKPEGEFIVFSPRKQDVEYSIEHHGDRFFITTNYDAKNFRLMETPVAATSIDNWKEVIPHRDTVKLDGVNAFKDHLAIYERSEGLKKIRIWNLKTGEKYDVSFDEPIYTCWADQNPEFNTSVLRFNYTSLITPRTVYDYDMNDRTKEIKKKVEVLGGYDESGYSSERVYAVADDGMKVPMSLVYKKGIQKNGANPLYLYGYGSYGISMEPYFSPNRISLLDRGFIYAIAHIRGGGEMGRSWYENGKLLYKKNTFTDFIASAEYLIKQKYTNEDKLVICGGSAGGLLMGAVLNMRPDLFKVVIADVPFVDVVNTMLDSSIPLTVTEYEEWGNPNKEDFYDYMISYSPYDNIRYQKYPNILITAGLNDPRVQYWEPAKFTARLRAMKKDNNLLLLKTNMGAGHGGASGRYDRLKEIAFEYAFILDLLGIKE